MDIISNGALGFTASLVQFINQEYDYELNNLAYDPDIGDSQLTVESKPYQNFIL